MVSSQSINSVGPVADVGGAAETFSMKVEMFISGRKLKDLDVFSKSDPICILSEYGERSNQWVRLGQTEQIKDDLNPDFKTRFIVNYFFEKRQRLKFTMIDWDGAGEYDTIGHVETTLGAIMGAKGQILTADLTLEGKSDSRGLIIIRAEGVKESNVTAHFQMRWTNLNNVKAGCLGMCKGFEPVRFQISRKTPGKN